MIRTISLMMKYFIEQKEFFLYPYKEIKSIFDIVLSKQIWFSHFFIDFIHQDFFNASIDYQKSIIYNQYAEIKLKNKYRKLFFYKVILVQDPNHYSTEHLEELFSWLKTEKIHVNLIVMDSSSNKVLTIFSNFKDQENIESFIKENIGHIHNKDIEEINLLEIEKTTKEKKGYYFAPKKAYFTSIFMALNILYFIYISMSGSTTDISHIIQFGAKYNPLIADGQYFRLITSMFIHIGVLHLLLNTYALKILGKDVEFMYGSLKFILIYLLAGIFGSLASFLFSNAVSAGASGAIFGLMGAYLYFGIRKPTIFSSRYGMNIITMLILNIVFGLTNSNIDNFAHLGGLMGGFFTSYALGLKGEKIFKLKQMLFQILIIIFIITTLFTGVNIHQQSWEYHLHKGVNYLKEKDFEHAELQFEEGLKKNENISEFYFYLAYSHYQQGNRDTAIQYLKKTLSIDPNDQMAKNFLNDIQNE
ncbi:rhomboid family protein [Marinisporobacter balticus]|uniref:Rhomboid protease GluP n=1 Tax=Marinisporobacter balticus TaxID=2018667 RepID=A0A4R2KJZ1_9FIRM|nr:rhomboid family intramembrane serine protease [Marinisporobacter balticus]TCO73624.1 rhomboid protease GluP [Marinisporobacter balticus]